MTETEWLTCSDPGPMLQFLQRARVNRTKAGRRKLRLFGCGCSQRVAQFTSEQGRIWLDLSQKLADRLLTSAERKQVDMPGISPFDKPAGAEADLRSWRMGQSADQAAWFTLSPNVMAAAEVTAHLAAMVFGIEGVPTGRSGLELAAERMQQTALLRCIFGSRFRIASPVPTRLVWNNGLISTLAHSIYDDRAFDRLPLLADALEDAGCTDTAILDHCRGPGPHVRGCWVIDLLLGKQ